jgi:dephospho-CoA kinase
LAELVFGVDSESEARRKKLEETIHPLIHAEAVRRLRGFKEQDDPPRAIVIDAPLLLEAGWEPLCDLILFVDAPRSLRLERARQRGWSEAEFDYREAAQRTLDDKRRAATNIVHSTDPKQLRKELQQLWDKF